MHGWDPEELEAHSCPLLRFGSLPLPFHPCPKPAPLAVGSLRSSSSSLRSLPLAPPCSPVPCPRSASIALAHMTCSESEPEEEVAVRRLPPVAVGGTAVPGRVVPAATSDDTGRAVRWPHWVSLFVCCVAVVPIVHCTTPIRFRAYRGDPRHWASGLRRELGASDYRCSCQTTSLRSAGSAPRGIMQSEPSLVCSQRASAAGIFPLSFGRQPCNRGMASVPSICGRIPGIVPADFFHRTLRIVFEVARIVAHH